MTHCPLCAHKSLETQRYRSDLPGSVWLEFGYNVSFWEMHKAKIQRFWDPEQPKDPDYDRIVIKVPDILLHLVVDHHLVPPEILALLVLWGKGGRGSDLRPSAALNSARTSVDIVEKLQGISPTLRGTINIEDFHEGDVSKLEWGKHFEIFVSILESSLDVASSPPRIVKYYPPNILTIQDNLFYWMRTKKLPLNPEAIQVINDFLAAVTNLAEYQTHKRALVDLPHLRWIRGLLIGTWIDQKNDFLKRYINAFHKGIDQSSLESVRHQFKAAIYNATVPMNVGKEYEPVPIDSTIGDLSSYLRGLSPMWNYTVPILEPLDDYPMSLFQVRSLTIGELLRIQPSTLMGDLVGMVV